MGIHIMQIKELKQNRADSVSEGTRELSPYPWYKLFNGQQDAESLFCYFTFTTA